MEYATLSARLATFEPPTKRSKLGWPHTTPAPEDLANAGFYFKPQGTRSDNVICYLCERALDGWEKDDDPVQEHLKHSPECGWAIMMNTAREASNKSETLEDPTNELFAEARRATFSVGWPHESKRGWTCKTEKMVEAGWYFAPTAEYEDFVSCAHCKLSLDGWEPKDNPFDEHYRRSPDCLFFVFAGTTAPSKRPKTKKGRASRASRTSKASTRLSTQSNISMLSEATSIPDLDESIDTSTTSVLSTMSTASTTGNKGKRKASSGRTKSTKAKKTKTARAPKSKKAEPELELEEVHQAAVEKQLLDAVENGIRATPSPEREVEVSYPQLGKQSPVPVAVPSPTPASAASRKSVISKSRTQIRSKSVTPPQSPTLPRPHDQRSPSQNSDIENAPPSTRPSSVRPPLSSPGAVVPTWTPVDVELVFQSRPAPELLEQGGQLSEQEKDMTVQEWIEHIASKAERDLRDEGERVVGVFEKEGAKAMTVLEALVCV